MSLVKELCGAVLTVNVSSLRRLISEGGDVNTNHASETACTRAINHGIQSVMDTILYSENCDINAGNGDDRTPLFIASKLGRLNVVKQIVALGADINKSDYRRTTPLMVAIREGHTDVASYLIENDADLECGNFTGETALHIACERVNVEIVGLLLSHNVTMNKQTSDYHRQGRFTPLMFCVQAISGLHQKNKTKSDAVKVIQMLIKEGCNLDGRDIHGNTALHQAAELCDVHTVCLLAESGANLQIRNFVGECAFDIAVKKKQYGLSSAICLLLYGYHINGREYAKFIVKKVLIQVLDDFQHKEKMGILENDSLNRLVLLYGFLLKDASYLLESVDLSISVHESKLHLLQLLPMVDIGLESLTHQCRRTIRRTISTQLLKGISSLPIPKFLKMFLALDYDYFHNDPKCLCALLLAIEDNDLKSAEQLIKSGLNVDANIMDYTPLTYSVMLGNVDIMKLLLNNGADPMVFDSQGSTALHEAAGNGRVDILEILLKHDTDINMTNYAGETPIMKAALSGHFTAVQYLVGKGAESVRCNKHGRFLIHYATASGNLPACKTLLENGSSVDQRDSYGNTPLHLAASRGCLYTANNIDLPALFPVEAVVHSETSRNKFTEHSHAEEFVDIRTEQLINCISHKEVVCLLLLLGADRNIFNHAGKTAIDVAIRFDHGDIVGILNTG